MQSSKAKNQPMGSALFQKVVLLLLLTSINTSGVLIARRALSSSASKDLNINYMILVTEMGKGLLSCVCESITTRGRLIESLRASTSTNPQEWLKPAIPAILYLIQNVLTYYAIVRLSPPLIQVTCQAKLIVTAAASYMLLGRKYTRQQYLCLLGLSVGVAIVLIDGSTEKGESSLPREDFFLGIMAVGAACVLNAFAGVHFELLLKATSTEVEHRIAKPYSMWIRNMQLSVFTILFLLAERTWSGSSIQKPSLFFRGFSLWVWFLIVIRVSQSVVIAAVLKYADNVLKGIASSLSLCLSTALSSFFFGTYIGAQFLFGTSLALLSAFMFSNAIDEDALRCICEGAFLRRKTRAIQIFLFFATMTSLFTLLKFEMMRTTKTNIQASFYAMEPANCHTKCYTSSTFCTEGEDEYLTNYPDVEKAVSQGALNSGFHHFKMHGVKEGRHYICGTKEFISQQHCLSYCLRNDLLRPPLHSPNASKFGPPQNAFNETYFYSLPRYGGHCPGIHERCTANYAKSWGRISQRSLQGGCAKMLDVLQWLTQVMNQHEERMILWAGGLIKVLRDKTFFWQDGSPIDLDIDFLVSFESFDFVSRLEPLLWKRFGWTIRSFINCDGSSVFLQLIPACSHVLSDACDKAQQPEPGIELYASYEFQDTAAVTVLWEQECFLKRLILPPQHHIFNLPGSNRMIDFQIPQHSEYFLTCVYGNWSVYSAKPSHLRKPVRDACSLAAAKKLGFYKEAIDAISMCNAYYIDRP